MKRLLLFALFAPAFPLAAEISMPRVELLLSSPDVFDGKGVCVQGKAENLRAAVSAQGKPYFTLELAEGGQRLKVFSFGTAGVRNGQAVLACGRFQMKNQVGKIAYRNELAACLVESPPGLFGTLESGRRPVFAGVVTGILDGDTLEVLALKRPRRVRLDGVDCPEKGQAFGDRAKRFTSDLAFNQPVTVEVTDIDKYGRMIAWVKTKNGRVINEEIVGAGLGWWYRKYAPGNKTLERLELEAREIKRGLWRDKKPVPPWEFRQSAGRARSR